MSSIKGEEEVTQSSVHLDAVRGIAALIVVLGHTRELFFSSITGQKGVSKTPALTTQGLATQSPHRDTKITIGHEAVMIFFVLSGYLVGGTVLRAVNKGKWSWKTYASKRLTRLWIVLIPALLFGLVLDNVGLRVFPGPSSIYSGPSGQTTIPPNISSTLISKNVVGNMLFLQTILVPTLGTNIPLWSLANEFWYYLAFPLLILAFVKSTPLSLRTTFLILFILIGAGVGKNIALLFPIWCLGALISVLPLWVPKRATNILILVFVIIMCVSLVVVRVSPLSALLAEWAIALTFACLLYLLLHRTEQAHAGVYRTVSSFFSQISYTLYLVHLPLAVFLCACLNNPWRQWSKTIPNISVVATLFGTLICFAFLFYLAFEANTDRVRLFVLHRRSKEEHVPRAAPTIV